MFSIKLIGLLCCLTVANCVDYDIEDRVLVLNDSNFDAAIKEHKHVFAMFDVSCLDKCEALVPKLAKAAKQLEEEGSDIKVAKVYATFKGLLVWKYTQSLPKLMFFRNGHPVDYKGSHTIEEMIQWVKKKTEPPAQILSTVDDARIFVNSARVTIVGFFKNQTSLEAKEFLKAAYTIDRHAFAITSDDAVYKELGASKDGVMLFKKFDERRKTLALKPTCDKIRTFVAVNSQPLVVVLTAQYAQLYLFHFHPPSPYPQERLRRSSSSAAPPGTLSAPCWPTPEQR
nr:protein disulfide-isomerase-like [Rhipicephalus microplus]